ncbi:uncharacterized protein LOC114916447 [Cajanus cajan]|uniref:uncharacterized protein LOC114916447 n=1 Tax=Cajanus cajan TaxID=3821 RepID=UPI0010FB9C69|nr:uncharacterized protein LOC114916447 [Cajanus cajan]
MMNYFLSLNKENVEKNERIHPRNSCNQMLNRFQSLRDHSMTPQGMQQRPQNCPRPLNFMQGKCQDNNNVDVKPQLLMPHVFSGNNVNLSRTRHDQMLPFALSSIAQRQTDYRNLMSLPSQTDSNKKNLINSVDLQSHTSSFLNPSTRATFHNQENLYGANSLYPNDQRNNSSMFNYSNPLPRVNMNTFHAKDIAKPNLLPPIQIQHLNLLSYKDIAQEKTMKRPWCEVQENDIMTSVSKRQRMNFTPPNYYEVQPGIKELLLFKDEKHSVLNVKIKNDAKKNNVRDNLDLSLHL